VSITLLMLIIIIATHLYANQPIVSPPRPFLYIRGPVLDSDSTSAANPDLLVCSKCQRAEHMADFVSHF
jgi:hypothetical protein